MHTSTQNSWYTHTHYAHTHSDVHVCTVHSSDRQHKTTNLKGQGILVSQYSGILRNNWQGHQNS